MNYNKHGGFSDNRSCFVFLAVLISNIVILYFVNNLIIFMADHRILPALLFV